MSSHISGNMCPLSYRPQVFNSTLKCALTSFVGLNSFQLSIPKLQESQYTPFIRNQIEQSECPICPAICAQFPE